MFSPHVFGRIQISRSRTRTAVASVLAAGIICLSACGSDKDTTNSPAGDGNTTPIVTGVNSDATGAEPKLAPLSNAVKSTTAAGASKDMPYVLFSSSPNAAVPAKAFAVTAYDYDVCTFGFNHGYAGFPSSTFNFVGFYLVNGTPGAALQPGVYTAGATEGMYIDTQYSGAGYSIDKCKAADYPTVASGTVEITALGTGTGGTAGTMNVTMSDGSVFSGTFTTGACSGGGNATQPTPASPDPYACTKIN